LIVLSSHGRSGLSGWNVSSVVQRILWRARLSILLVPAYQPASSELTGLRYGRILVPLDGSQRAECVLPLVMALAREQGSQVLLAHVVRRPELPRRAPASREDQALADQITERNRLEAAKYLEELQSRLPVSVSTRLLVSEHVAATLHLLAAQEKVDLLAISAHGYSGGTQWPYGSLAISFIAYGSSPLLIVQDLGPEEIGPTVAELAVGERQKN
jgi:nucleotide-binding universal stress UspA family protein